MASSLHCTGGGSCEGADDDMAAGTKVPEPLIGCRGGRMRVEKTQTGQAVGLVPATLWGGGVGVLTASLLIDACMGNGPHRYAHDGDHLLLRCCPVYFPPKP